MNDNLNGFNDGLHPSSGIGGGQSASEMMYEMNHRIFKTRPFGYEVDLDDPKTFAYLPNTTKELRTLMFSEIGMYYCYVNYWHPVDFDMQREGVEKLIKDFTENEKRNYKNVMWYKEQIFMFQNETENMC